MNLLFSTNWLLIAAGWYGLNGLLHDFFVVRAHKDGYNRELLRLLMDGHMLMLSAALLVAGWWIVRSGEVYGALIGLIVAIGMLVYCALIFPFLKSFGTLGITILLGMACVVTLARPHF